MTILRGTGLERSTHRLEEAFGSAFVAPLLHQHVEFGTMLVDRTPQQVRFATKRDEHLVEVPRGTRLASHRFRPMNKALTKLVYMNGPLCARLSCALINVSADFGDGDQPFR